MISDDTSHANSGMSLPGKTLSTAEIQPFLSYLQRIIPMATDFSSKSDVDELNHALSENSPTLEIVRRFLTDPQCAVFFIRITQQGKGNLFVQENQLHE